MSCVEFHPREMVCGVGRRGGGVSLIDLESFSVVDNVCVGRDVVVGWEREREGKQCLAFGKGGESLFFSSSQYVAKFDVNLKKEDEKKGLEYKMGYNLGGEEGRKEGREEEILSLRGVNGGEFISSMRVGGGSWGVVGSEGRSEEEC